MRHPAPATGLSDGLRAVSRIWCLCHGTDLLSAVVPIVQPGYEMRKCGLFSCGSLPFGILPKGVSGAEKQGKDRAFLGVILGAFSGGKWRL